MSNDKPIFIRQEILQQTINELEEKKAELLELQGKVSYMENYLIIFHNMSVGNSLVLEDIANLKIDTTGIKAAIEVVKADVIAVEAEIVTLTAGQGVLQTDVSNLTTSLTSVNAQVQLLNSGDMTISGQKTFDGTTIFNGEVDMTSTNNTTIGNTGGGITQIKGTTQINSADIGNTDIGNSGGGATTLNGTLQLSGGAAFSPTNIPAILSYGSINNIGGFRLIETTGLLAYTANTSIFALTNSTPLPYGRYVFNMRVYIDNNSAQVGFLNVFPAFTSAAQTQGSVAASVQNQIGLGGQREGGIDFIFASNQKQVFNEAGMFYLDSGSFPYPILGANFSITINCNVKITFGVTRVA